MKDMFNLKGELSENEKSVLSILNMKENPKDIWTSVQELVSKSTMGVNELEVALYLLQLRGMVRVTMDEMHNIKITTEKKVEAKISSRVNTALGGMEEAMQEAVEEENYEEAAKLRDWIQMSKDPSKQNELIDSLLNDTND